MNKWMIWGYPYFLIGFSLINHPFWGTVPLFLVQHPYGRKNTRKMWSKFSAPPIRGSSSGWFAILHEDLMRQRVQEPALTQPNNFPNRCGFHGIWRLFFVWGVGEMMCVSWPKLCVWLFALPMFIQSEARLPIIHNIVICNIAMSSTHYIILHHVGQSGSKSNKQKDILFYLYFIVLFHVVCLEVIFLHCLRNTLLLSRTWPANVHFRCNVFTCVAIIFPIPQHLLPCIKWLPPLRSQEI